MLALIFAKQLKNKRTDDLCKLNGYCIISWNIIFGLPRDVESNVFASWAFKGSQNAQTVKLISKKSIFHKYKSMKGT